MKVKVLFHDHCFDGAASASLFGRFFRERIMPADIVYSGKSHRRGPVFDEKDFDADEHAVLDFRYAQDARLGWWFDHHASAFQGFGDEQHFRTRSSDHFFFDPTARSCAGLVVRSLTNAHGWDVTPYEELATWAEIIDGAQFGSAEEATSLEPPAMQLAAFIENNRDTALQHRFIDELTSMPLAALAQEPWVRSVVTRVAEEQQNGERLLGTHLAMDHHVALIDLGGEQAAYNKFSPYKLAPDASYVVSVSASHGSARVSVGINPWHRPDAPHHIARLCERYGGGGHPYVGGVTLHAATPELVEEARRIAREMVSVLSEEP